MAFKLPVHQSLNTQQVGQIHDGFLNIFMKALSRASTHIWFERSDAKDRAKVIER